MRTVKSIFRKRFYFYLLMAVVFGGTLMLNNNSSHGAYAAANDTMFLSPGSGTFTVGNNFTVSIFENSNSDQVNTAEADLNFPSSKLQYVTYNNTGFGFNIAAQFSNTNNSVSMQMGSTTPLTGQREIGTVTFKVIASGSATISFAGSSQVQSFTTHTNVAGTLTGASYTLETTTTAPPATTKPPAKSTPKPASKKTAPVTTHSSAPASTTTTTIAPKNNPKPVTVPGNSTVELNGQATVQTSPSSPAQISKVEYFLNGKLVATVTKPPFNYSVNTPDLRNGNYKLSSKTFYTDGTTGTKNTALLVKNPFGWTQFQLQVQHYAILIILALVIAVDALWTLVRRNRHLDGPRQHSDPTPTEGPAAPVVHVGMM